VLLVLAARAPWTPAPVARILIILGYLGALVVLWLNRAQRWCPVVLLGTALNTAAILANAGRMPVGRPALERIDGPLSVALKAGADPRHVLAGPSTPLGFLGDQVAVGGWGGGLIVSPGDVVLAFGIAGLVQAAMRGEDSSA